jgi:hypothetical protein
MATCLSKFRNKHISLVMAKEKPPQHVRNGHSKFLNELASRPNKFVQNLNVPK